ncbi:TetR/AcrR family transcriptional regulator [Nitratireductor rhodophyticola]|uniref:TetR/AcrR family transcriptional regulator n=1 Tax=Nitratireductor rhodophyticola TaxID=2854036 RepID=UPI00300B78D6
MNQRPKFRRDGAELWIAAAYANLVEDGHGGLTVEKLTARTGKTRGSFYHHFGSHDGFVDSFLDDWRQQNTDRIERLIAADPEPRKRRAVLNREASWLDTRVETAIRRWAGANQIVAAVCREVDRRRMDVIARDLVAIAESEGVRLAPEQAHALALADYAMFLGAQMLAPDGVLAALPDVASVIDEMLDAYFLHLKRAIRIKTV